MQARQIETRPEVFDRIDEVFDTLLRLRAMFAAVIYLMGGEDHALEGDYADFEVWFGDIKDRLDSAVEVLADILPMIWREAQ